jgi:hypothetical protein
VASLGPQDTASRPGRRSARWARSGSTTLRSQVLTLERMGRERTNQDLACEECRDLGLPARERGILPLDVVLCDRCWVTSAGVVYRRPLGDLVLRLCGEFGGQGRVVGF